MKNNVQANWTTLITIDYKKFSYNFGYSLWAKSCEKFGDKRSRECAVSNQPSLIDLSQSNVWALKGDANMFGFATLNAGGLSLNEAVALSASQFNSTINAGTNSTATGADPILRNLGIDNERFAYAGTNNQRLNYASGLSSTESSHIKTSINPTFINIDDIALIPVRGISHKLLFNFNCDEWPYFYGAGASIEFGQNKASRIPENSSLEPLLNSAHTQCTTSSLSQWSIWFKGGITF